MTDDNLVWSFAEREPNPYQEEWIHLIDAIRNDKEYNEVDRGVKSSIATSMARMAAHTGQVITYDDLLNCEHEFAPNLENMDYDSEPPVVADANGKYPCWLFRRHKTSLPFAKDISRAAPTDH